MQVTIGKSVTQQEEPKILLDLRSDLGPAWHRMCLNIRIDGDDDDFEDNDPGEVLSFVTTNPGVQVGGVGTRTKYAAVLDNIELHEGDCRNLSKTVENTQF